MSQDPESAATLERRIYARLDEVLGPVNEALDAVTLRLDALAREYAVLTARVGAYTAQCDPDLYTSIGGLRAAIERHDLGISVIRTAQEQQANEVSRVVDLGAELERQVATLAGMCRTTDAVLEQQERRFGDLARRDRQVEAQLEGLAKDVVGLGTKLQDHGDLGLEPLSARVDDLEERFSGRLNALHARLDKKSEELTHALEDHVHKVSGEAALPEAEISQAPKDAPYIKKSVQSTSFVKGGPYDTAVARTETDSYEVDGHPATREEYEAAERDDKAPHTTRHVHRPFSDGVSLRSTAHPGSNEVSPESLEEIEIEVREPVHDIGWAARQALSGKRIRRAFWYPGVFYLMQNGRLLQVHPADAKAVPVYSWTCDAEMAATDWELA